MTASSWVFLGNGQSKHTDGQHAECVSGQVLEQRCINMPTMEVQSKDPLAASPPALVPRGSCVQGVILALILHLPGGEDLINQLGLLEFKGTIE